MLKILMNCKIEIGINRSSSNLLLGTVITHIGVNRHSALTFASVLQKFDSLASESARNPSAEMCPKLDVMLWLLRQPCEAHSALL